jgi:hypothetical protein
LDVSSRTVEQEMVMATKPNQAHRSGAVVMRGAEKRPTEDQQLLQQEAPDDSFLKTDTWRALRIMGEFVEGFDALAGIGRAVSVFGSARIGRGDPSYRMARSLSRKLAKHGYAIITGGGAQARPRRAKVAGPTGFEPAISSVTGWHVGPLHHGPAGAPVAEYSRGAFRPQIGSLPAAMTTTATTE